MKRIILILILCYSFCVVEDIYYLEKYGVVKSSSKKGIVYLDIEEFKLKDTIHILFNVVNGDMTTTIEYGYNDLAPENLTMSLDHSMNPTMNTQSDSSTTTEKKNILKYYYDIEKEENKKYIIIRYSGFFGSYIEIENTRYNWGKALFIIIFASIGVIILVVIIIYFTIRYIRNRGKSDTGTDFYLPP